MNFRRRDAEDAEGRWDFFAAQFFSALSASLRQELIYRHIASALMFLALLGLAPAGHALENKLKSHPSPYLALHGADPVAWQDWNEVAVELERPMLGAPERGERQQPNIKTQTTKPEDFGFGVRC